MLKKFQIFLGRFEILVNFQRKNENNSYQIQITFKKSEIFRISGHCSEE
jgi:hypothetical protein